MEQQRFSTLISNLNEFISEIDNILQGVKCPSDVENLSVKQLLDMADKLKNIESKYDSFCSAELYHIIGMENMSVNQQLIFLETVKNLLNKRPLIKPFFMLNQDVLRGHINAVGKQSKYKCKLAGIECDAKSNNY